MEGKWGDRFALHCKIGVSYVTYTLLHICLLNTYYFPNGNHIHQAERTAEMFSIRMYAGPKVYYFCVQARVYSAVWKRWKGKHTSCSVCIWMNAFKTSLPSTLGWHREFQHLIDINPSTDKSQFAGPLSCTRDARKANQGSHPYIQGHDGYKLVP